MAQQTNVERLAERLCWEVRELSLGTGGEIKRIQGAPTSLRFLRDFVLPNKPCIITNAIDHWPALAAWTNPYLRASLANQWVSVHSTPNGFADAVVDLGGFMDSAIHAASCTALEKEHVHTSSSTALPDEGLHYVDSASDYAPEKNSLDAHNTDFALDGSPQGDKARPLDYADEVHTISYCGKDIVNNQCKEKFTPSGASSAAEAPFLTAFSGGEQMHSAAHALSITSDNSTGVNYKTHAASKHGEDGVIGLPLHCQKSLSTDAMGVGEDSKVGSLYKAACEACGIEPKEESRDQVWFVTAHVDRVLFPIALDMILHSEIGSGVAYAQEQNGCFLSEYSVLAADAETHLPWATEAFGCFPEAVNLWIGNEKAVTSFHKDHYENLYAVIAGEKHFTLLPPTDVHRLYIRQYPSAHYVKHEGKFAIEQEKPIKFVPWASVDPYPPAESASEAKAKFPEFFDGPTPFTCTLQAGEILYLPSLWFHDVRQSPDLEGRTIALNFWYDMQFDVKYAYYNFLESLILKS